MDRKAMNKAFKLAAYFCLLAVALRGASVEACQQEDEDCSSLACCDGLECVEVSPGVFQCEPEGCEPHIDHECTVHERECCDVNTLTCVCDPHATDPNDGTCKYYTKKLREECDPNTDRCERRAECLDPEGDGTYHCQCKENCDVDCQCCVNALCTTKSDGTKECICNKKKGETCDPSAHVPECCENECVAVAVDVYECQPV